MVPDDRLPIIGSGFLVAGEDLMQFLNHCLPDDPPVLAGVDLSPVDDVAGENGIPQELGKRGLAERLSVPDPAVLAGDGFACKRGWRGGQNENKIAKNRF